MFAIREREVPEQLVLTEQRYVRAGTVHSWGKHRKGPLC
jgi:hypothetical protein